MPLLNNNLAHHAIPSAPQNKDQKAKAASGCNNAFEIMWSRLKSITSRHCPAYRAAFNTRSFRRGYQTVYLDPDPMFPDTVTVQVLSDERKHVVYLDLFNFDRQKPFKSQRALYIYLPSGTHACRREASQHTGHEYSDLQKNKWLRPPSLFKRATFPAIRINYQYHGRRHEHNAGSTAQDIQIAYKVILDEFCNEKTKIGILGRFIGSPLALSLALNNHSSTDRRITAVALDGGIFDWSSLAAMQGLHNSAWICGYNESMSIKYKKTQVYQIADILRIRKIMLAQFSTLAGCFDPFASPALYFRTAGLEIPSGDGIWGIDPHAYDERLSGERRTYTMDDFVPITSSPREQIRFPPENSKLEIPRILFAIQDGAFWTAAALEMVQLLRKSIISYSGALDAYAEALDRVQYIKFESLQVRPSSSGFRGFDGMQDLENKKLEDETGTFEKNHQQKKETHATMMSYCEDNMRRSLGLVPLGRKNPWRRVVYSAPGR